MLSLQPPSPLSVSVGMFKSSDHGIMKNCRPSESGVQAFVHHESLHSDVQVLGDLPLRKAAAAIEGFYAFTAALSGG